MPTMFTRIAAKSAVLTALCLSTGTVHAASAPVTPVVGLSVAIKKNLSGLDDDAKEVVLEQARTFIRFRRGQMPAKKKLLWIADCFKRPGENIFCDYIVEKRRLP